MQDLCVTATRDHNVYASFRPSIATKDAETRSKMNTGSLTVETNMTQFPGVDYFKMHSHCMTFNFGCIEVLEY